MDFKLRGVSMMAGLACALAFAAPASAQMVESVRSKEILQQWNEAIQAAITCEKRTFTIDEETKMAEAAGKASGMEYSTGSMLQTVSDSRPWVRAVQASKTCNDPWVSERLAFFRNTVAPSLR